MKQMVWIITAFMLLTSCEVQSNNSEQISETIPYESGDNMIKFDFS